MGDNHIVSGHDCSNMAYKLAVLVVLVATAIVAVDFSSTQTIFDFPYTELFQKSSTASCSFFTKNEPDLSKVSNHSISRTCSTGAWLYYEQANYNAWYEGEVIWKYGIDYCSDMPDEFATGSFRYAGSPTSFDGASFTLYEGLNFTGADFYGTEDFYNDLIPNSKSLIVTGASNWTFYTENDYGGNNWCAPPAIIATKADKTLHGISWVNIYNDAVRSVKKGCHSSTILAMDPLPAFHQTANGASFMLPKQ